MYSRIVGNAFYFNRFDGRLGPGDPSGRHQEDS